jgi:hypothetical protein
MDTKNYGRALLTADTTNVAAMGRVLRTMVEEMCKLPMIDDAIVRTYAENELRRCFADAIVRLDVLNSHLQHFRNKEKQDEH